MGAAAASPGHKTLWVFDGDELLEDLVKRNERMKDSIKTEVIGLSLFLKSAKQSVQQIKLLGVMGRAYHKVGGNGRKYIIFKGNSRARPDLRGTRYLASNPKVACFVVGGREIVKDAMKATKLAVILLVAYDIIRELQEDRFSLASLGVRVFSDVLQAAGSAALGAAAGIVAATLFGAPVVLTFAIVVAAGFAAGMLFSYVDQRYQLTERARARMMEFEEQARDRLRAVKEFVTDATNFVSTVIGVAQQASRFYRTVHEFTQSPLRLF